MRIKKTNAVLGLLSILFMMAHIGYTDYAYLAFYYNPFLKLVFAIPFMACACLHAVCGMLIVFTQSDGTRMDLYANLNVQTVLQRVTAALIFPLLILHINTFSLMKACAEKGQTFFIFLLILAELVFFAVVLTHTSVSLTRSLITLGLLESREKQKSLDRIVYVISGLIYAVSVFAIVKVQLAMFVFGS